MVKFCLIKAARSWNCVVGEITIVLLTHAKNVHVRNNRHGAADDFILPAWGRATAQRLESLGVDVNYDEVPGLMHQLEV
eukprot:SAG11_NODE_36340_length_262_cov_0.631902_1_plen_78_part_01